MKTHKTCPRCGGHDCFTVFDDGGGYCHQGCGYVSDKKKESMEENELTFEHRGYRGISKELAEKYNVLTGVDQEGNEFSRVYPYPHKPKVRILPKDFSKNKGFTNDHLLGMDYFNAGSSKKITVVEGEDDWLSALQMLGDKWPVVALPGSGTVTKVLQNHKCYNYLKAFDSIMIATDSDEAGNKTADILSKTFPNKCYRVNMSKHNDPNDYLTNNDGSEFMFAWINAKKYVPENIFNTTEQFINIIKNDTGSMYLPTGIQAFDDVTLGLFQGYWTNFQAPEGIGKTEFMRLLEYSILSNHPTVPIAVMHMEETKKRSLLGLASYVLQKDVTLQDTKIELDSDGNEVIQYLPSYKGTPEEEVIDAIKTFTDQENFYQFTMGVDDDPMTILDQIRYFREVCGVKYVFFEPIQDLAYSRQTDESIEQWLSSLSTKMARLCSELGVGVITVAHENDDGAIRDCRMIGKRAGVCIKLERDKQATDPEIRNQTTLTILKNRPVGNTGFAGVVQFDPNTFTISEQVF